jgi:large subunit ribosomal protein L10
MLRTDKESSIAEIKSAFERATSTVFVDYKGMTVAEVSKLRNICREKGVLYKVLKNTLVKQALGSAPYATKLSANLKGMTAVAWSFEEPSAAARILKDYAKDNEKLKIKAGLLDGQVLDGKAVENQLATLPSKDEARSMLLATLNAPAQQFVMLLNAPAGSFVRVLQAKATQG